MTNLESFIHQELENRREDYSKSPTYILEHYNGERNNIEEYNGRQLFEMLQNADDASEKSTSPKVKIKLSGDELIISNNGQPFSKEGFRSILYRDVSPKLMQRNKIGHKGLGFRSILSWADDVVINSANVKVGFSENYAKSFLKELIIEFPEIKKFLAERSKEDFPIATLRIPRLLKTKNENSEYDTIITIKLKDTVLDDVQTQISSMINKETLLFLNHLKIIEIDSPETKVIFTKTINDNDSITIESNNLLTGETESKTWTLKKAIGTHKFQHKGKNEVKHYELAIAWNEKLDDTENVIYSYFKTQVKFPFPALLHGTFELNSSRNQLVKDTFGHNKFLIEKLAEFLIETALEISSKDTKANYLPLKLLNVNFNNIDGIIEKFNFKEVLIDKIKSSKVFPNVNGTYVSYENQPVYYSHPIADILSGDDVNNLMPHCDDKHLVTFINSLPSYQFTINDLCSLISKRLKTLNNVDIAKLFQLLFTYQDFKNKLLPDKFEFSDLPAFIPDNDGNPISWDSSIFLPSQDKTNFKLPKLLKVRFINSDLVEHLLKIFRRHQLIDNFENLSVKEYSFRDISLTLINHYKEKKKLKTHDVQELHSYLYRLFKSEKNEPNDLSDEIQTPIISLTRKIRNASDVYFGKFYDNELAEQLYCYDKSKILASPKAYVLERENPKAIKNYFKWLGVAELPRYAVASFEDWQYKKYILRNFDYKKPIDSYYNDHYKDYYDLQPRLNKWGNVDVGCFDDLKNILKKSKYKAIFEWIKKDIKLKRTLEEDIEILSNTNIAIAIDTKRNYRYIRGENLRSYTRWLFSNTAWLPVNTEGKVAEPDKCCLSKTITKEFSPFVEKPAINVASLADKLRIPEETFENYLAIIGVHREISEFSTNRLYKMLLSLPKLDKEGNVTRSIYREIIMNFDEKKLDVAHPSYKSFLSDGKVFCQKGNETEYFNIDEAFYIDTKIFGKNVLKRFPLVVIDRKRGTQKVNRLFGIKPLEHIEFNILNNPPEHSLQNKFNEEIQSFKAYVYTLRIHQDTKHQIRNKLKHLRIILSPSIEAEFVHNQNSEKFEIERYEFVSLKNKTTFYVFVPESIKSIDELRGTIDFRESIAEIFTMLINTEVHRSFIRELYSTYEVDREPLLMNELQQSTNEILVESKKQLDIIDDIRLSFWRAFSIASKKKLKTEISSETDLSTFLTNKLNIRDDVFQDLYELGIYSDLSELETQKLLHDLFLRYRVNYGDFQRHFSGLDFTHLFRNECEDIKAAYYPEFSKKLFDKLLSESLAEKRQYFSYIDDYQRLRYESSDEFIDNIGNYFIEKVKYNFSIVLEHKSNEFSYDKIIEQNLQQFNEHELSVLKTLKIDRHIQSLILFNEVDELKKIIIRHTTPTYPQSSYVNTSSKRIKLRGKEITFENYASLAKQALQGIDFSKIKLIKSRTISVEEEEKETNKRKRKPVKRKVDFKQKNEEEIGFITELYAFHLLSTKHGKENVRWLSENSYRAESSVTGEAGEGYDMQIIENGEVRYVEVKGVSDIRNGIKITSNEINKAIEFPDKYDLLIIESPLDENPTFRYWKSPFKFRGKESLLSNNSFKVFNDSYVIRFSWKE